MLIRLAAALVGQLTLATLLINLMLYLTQLPTGDEPSLGRHLRRRAWAWGAPLLPSALALGRWCLGQPGPSPADPSGLPWAPWLALSFAFTLPSFWIFQFGLFKQFPHLAEQFRLKRR